MMPRIGFEEMDVRTAPREEARRLIMENHYTGTCHPAPTCIGLWDARGQWWEEELIGAIAFTEPSSPAVAKKILGEEHREKVVELHRMWTPPAPEEIPHCSGSWFISRALREVKRREPRRKACVSYADSTEGHSGTQYVAANGWYTGEARARKFYLDEDGNLRHPKQGGEYITREAAEKKGWSVVERGKKKRYVFPMPDGGHGEWAKREDVRDRLKVPIL